jgi:hypothetical protein
MANGHGWDEFLKLVPAEKLAAPKQNEAELTVLEQHTSNAIEGAAQLQNQQLQEAMAMTRRNVGEPPAPQWQYDAVTNWFRQWLAYYDSFNAVAQQLQSAGRPGIAARLQYLKDDTSKALGIQQSMAAQAAVSGRQWSKAQQDMADATTNQIQKMTADMKAHFDKMNKLWEENR